MEPPNIVLIHCHDLGRYLGCYGADVETPRLDGLADEGVRFDRHFVTAPQCSPSRSSLVTGRHPHQNGMLGLAHGDWELGPDERLLPQLLGEAGYETHRFGLQHVTEYPDRLGYDHEHVEEPLRVNTPPSVHETARAREVGEEFASVVAADEHEDPFFASVGFFECHRVEDEDGFGFDPDRYETPDPDDVDPLPFLPDRPGIRSDIAELQGMVRALDDGVGTVLDALEDAGLAEDTLVVFTTEHGLAFPRAKGCCYDAGIGAALLLRYPGVVDAGVVDDLASNVDVFPTLLEFAGVEVPDGVVGRSLRGRLVDESAGGDGEYDPRERVFAGMTWHDRYNPIRAVRTDRYKYVRNFWHLPGIYLTRDIYESAAGSEVREEYYCEQRPYVELYDLETDPDERENLADDPDYEGVRERLRDDLIEWMLETDDPLLDGPVRPSDWEEIHPTMGDESA
ncbi:sulfatase family protein [Natronococcus occultus]|uniref:Arylsulfatase A family protein n=1 Tax=Natronococcus occultus SP4 TaxID=694430 RepID=L0K1N4_9EURY|nr:sulfatase [Natronococcus occultus]AGB38028.1 arylsulfatase A family protein [Natronococcus occultus SP4]